MTTSLIPMAEVRELAVATARSGFFAGVETAEKALVLMAIAQAEGCAPIQAMQRYHIIKGKPAKQAWAMLADFTSRGGKVVWIEHSASCCKATFSHPQGGEVTVEWTLEKARQAGIAGNDNWRKYPENMLHARCVSNGVRFVDPGAANGLYTPEEVQDFDAPFSAIPPEKRTIEVVAPAPRLAKPPAPSDGTKAKWDSRQPIPPVILRVLPGSQPIANTALNDLGVEDLEMVIEHGKRAYTDWEAMPSVSKKALALLSEITACAQARLDEQQGLVPPPGDEDASFEPVHQ